MATEEAASIRISIDWKLNDERARLDAIEVEMVEWRPSVINERDLLQKRRQRELLSRNVL